MIRIDEGINGRKQYRVEYLPEKEKQFFLI